MKTVKPISPRNQEYCEKQRKKMEELSNTLYHRKPFEYYKARQAFELELIMDAALDKAIEENDIQYIIKHKELEAAEKQAESLEFLADSLYNINLNYERNSE